MLREQRACPKLSASSSNAVFNIGGSNEWLGPIIICSIQNCIPLNINSLLSTPKKSFQTRIFSAKKGKMMDEKSKYGYSIYIDNSMLSFVTSFSGARDIKEVSHIYILPRHMFIYLAPSVIYSLLNSYCSIIKKTGFTILMQTLFRSSELFSFQAIYVKYVHIFISMLNIVMRCLAAKLFLHQTSLIITAFNFSTFCIYTSVFTLPNFLHFGNSLQLRMFFFLQPTNFEIYVHCKCRSNIYDELPCEERKNGLFLQLCISGVL